MAKVGRNTIVPAKGSVKGGSGSEQHGRADVVRAGLAEWAYAARDAGLNGHSIAGFKMLHGRADGVDEAGGLMPKDYGSVDDELANTTMGPIMDI